MKKLTFLGLAIALSTNFANAQVRFGIEGGANINNQLDHYQGETTSNQLKVGAHAGGIADIMFAPNWSVQPGLKYILKGGQTSRSFVQGFNNTTVFKGEFEDKLSLHYVELPVNVVYHIPMQGGSKMFVGVGGYASLLASARSSFKYDYKITDGDGNEMTNDQKSGDRQLEVGGDVGKDDIQPFDYGLTGIVGYQLPMGLYFKAGVDAGLKNIITGHSVNGYAASLPAGVNASANPSSKNVSYLLTIGYMFNK